VEGLARRIVDGDVPQALKDKEVGQPVGRWATFCNFEAWHSMAKALANWNILE